MSKYFNTDHKNYNFSFQDVMDCYDYLTWIYDEPYGDSSMFPTYLVSKLAKKDVKVALSGDGGDETFGGYMAYVSYKSLFKWKRIPLTGLAGKILLNFHKRSFYYLGRALIGLAKFNDLYFIQQSKFTPPEMLKLLTHPSQSDLYRKHRKYWNSQRPFERPYDLRPEDLSCRLLVAKNRQGINGGKFGVRVPYLDHFFVEFANSIPAALKLTNTTKYILKRALHGILPVEIIDRKKKGFGIPIKEWLSGEMAR